MRNITVAVGDDCYRQARIWAANNGTSVSAGLLAASPPPAKKQLGSFSGCETLEINLTEAESNT